MELLEHVAGVIGPIFLCAAVGFGWTKLDLPFDTRVITALTVNVAMPALIVSHLAEQHIASSDLWHMLKAALIGITLIGVVSAIFLSLCRLSLRTYLSAFMFANIGGIGLPAAHLAFGDPGLALAFGYWGVPLVGVLTIGTWLPQRGVSLRKVFSSTLIYAVLIGLALQATDVQLPQIIQAPLGILGGMAIPLTLLSLGHAIAGLKPSNLVQGFLLAMAQLAIVAGIAAVTIWLIELEGTVRSVFILEALIPVSILNYLFAQQYRPQDAPEVASLILFSTALTVITIPLALAFWI